MRYLKTCDFHLSRTMLFGLLLRHYSSAATSSLLGTLRRRSGFPLMKCKEALTKFGSDLEAAETWLQEEAQKEGWTKMAKLQGRQAKQGHIGLSMDDNRAAMVEVNCETDFVARNDQFKALVSTITGATFNHLMPKLLTTTNLASLDNLTADSILNISSSEGSGGSVAGAVAETVGHFQEKISVSRGCTLCCGSGILCGHVYNNRANAGSAVRMGPYGAILHMNSRNSSDPLANRQDLPELKKLGEQICQHIVGLNPATVEAGGSEGSLVDQHFLFDDSVTVGELMERNGICVTRFVRYALGEQEENPWTN